MTASNSSTLQQEKLFFMFFTILNLFFFFPNFSPPSSTFPLWTGFYSSLFSVFAPPITFFFPFNLLFSGNFYLGLITAEGLSGKKKMSDSSALLLTMMVMMLVKIFIIINTLSMMILMIENDSDAINDDD